MAEALLKTLTMPVGMRNFLFPKHRRSVGSAGGAVKREMEGSSF
jgi:hypothetical protein